MYYLDNAATTCVDDRVLNEIQQYMKFSFGNPSSVHSKGQEAHKAIDSARQIIAKTINCNPKEIIFTSGGSESNNLAIKGYYNKHTCGIITTKIEHKSVIKSCEIAKRFILLHLKVDELGFISIKELEEELQLLNQAHCNVLVSIQMANSEIGTIQNIKLISDVVHNHDGVLHVDAVQAYGSIPIDVKKLGIDMMSVSGHKLGAPKGVGFLYKKDNIEIEPLISGGSQESGLRAGTENVPYIMALVKAAEIAQQKNNHDISMVRDYFIDKLLEIPQCRINGALGNDRLPNNINVSFKGVDGEALLFMLDAKEIYVSNGSACNAGSLFASDVLTGINVPYDYIHGTIRITINDSITKDDVDSIVNTIKDSVELLRKMGGGENV